MISINQTALKAVSRFSGVKDVRYYLCGVLVQASPAETRLIATDGHTLAAHRTIIPSVDQAMGGNYADIIIPLDVVQAVLKWKPAKKGEGELLLSPVSGGVWELSMGEQASQSTRFKPVDGKFPDYRRVLPTALDGKLAQYNPEYLMRCKNVITDFTGKKGESAVIAIGYNGTGPAIVDCGLTSQAPVLRPGCARRLHLSR
jgi:DNA polymerase-3 subunit beta